MNDKRVRQWQMKFNQSCDTEEESVAMFISSDDLQYRTRDGQYLGEWIRDLKEQTPQTINDRNYYKIQIAQYLLKFQQDKEASIDAIDEIEILLREEIIRRRQTIKSDTKLHDSYIIKYHDVMVSSLNETELDLLEEYNQTKMRNGVRLAKENLRAIAKMRRKIENTGHGSTGRDVE